MIYMADLITSDLEMPEKKRNEKHITLNTKCISNHRNQFCDLSEMVNKYFIILNHMFCVIH